jgi:hypothetical protein
MSEEPDLLFGAAEIAVFVNALTGRDLNRRLIYQWAASGRLPAGKHGERGLIASKKRIRAHLECAADPK